MVIIKRKAKAKTKAKAKISFSEKSIISVLKDDWDLRHRFDLMVPNCFTQTDNEADFFGIRKSGMCDEFEIKISRSDFKNDVKKIVRHYEHGEPSYKWAAPIALNVNKHKLLQAGGMAPNYFWFVVPEGLVKPDEIPEKFGLYYITDTGGLRQVIPAKRLHKNKLPYEYRYYISKKMAYRYWDLIRSIEG